MGSGFDALNRGEPFGGWCHPGKRSFYLIYEGLPGLVFVNVFISGSYRD
jgi:hypothetical protein